ncbi:DUF6954 family protein [Ectobacillus ponti]|uniref:DUF6954 family protein n=1 Tax=Ectobacillus ponti TaxID=2961894 RepID=UPI003F66F59D
MNLIWRIFFTAAYLLITIFGLGPVLLADGSHTERWLALLITLGLYAVTTAGLRYVLYR